MSHSNTSQLVLEPADNRRLANLCGQFDENIRHIEQRLGVEISNRSNQFKIFGSGKPVRAACEVIQRLFEATGQETITPETVHLSLHDSSISLMADIDCSTEQTNTALIRIKKCIIKGRGPNQQQYLKNIQSYDVNFGIGPAGTGKTYLAVACAVAALEENRVQRLILARPAVEAGEKLGFLPGDMAQKVDPYLRPLYDALYEMMGIEKVAKLIDRNIIEVAPLAFMRGRTLNDSFIILDEAQNTTIEQIKMFLTRVGFGSTTVITGDITQVDLPRGKQSGLNHVLDVLNEIEGISFTFFHAKDVVRHPLVQKIVAAYEAHDRGQTQKND